VTDLLWPGDYRADDLLSDQAVLRDLVRVEAVWLQSLVAHGIAPASAGASPDDLLALVGDAERLAAEAECGGNPVIPLVRLMRERLAADRPDASRWLHRGLTSQDVIDSALMLGAAAALAAMRRELAAQAESLVGLVAAHRDAPAVARTLTQPALPTTFGLRVTTWLSGVLDAADDLTRVATPVQIGGAAGTLAAVVELGGDTADPVGTARAVAASTAAALGLSDAMPWHTNRAPVTRLGDVTVRCTDAWGWIAGDVLVLGRPEIGEVAEGTAGGSSTLPHKANPVLATLVRRAALAAPGLAATLHIAAAEYSDERPSGPWHAEWATLRTLLRRTVVAASQTSELLRNLRVDPDRMAANLAAVADDVLAEQRATAEVTRRAPSPTYLGATDAIINAVLVRARTFLEQPT
jgi:3-carboxy-cis,cis-muconate cycloisomerase